MSAATTPPDRGSYRFVMRKRPVGDVDHDPSVPERVSCYEEQVESRDITHPDGKRARTIFLQSQNSRDRLRKMGWEDVTELSIALQLAAPVSPAGQTSPGPVSQARRPQPKTLRVEG